MPTSRRIGRKPANSRMETPRSFQRRAGVGFEMDGCPGVRAVVGVTVVVVPVVVVPVVGAPVVRGWVGGASGGVRPRNGAESVS
jgi:hypothetical protein